MRGLVAIHIAASCLGSTLALPVLNNRAPADAAKKPTYSVVPLEPGNPNDGSGGNDPDGKVTVVKTVTQVKSKAPSTATEFITVTADPATVTKTVPTTVISIVNVQGEAATTVTVTPTWATPPSLASNFSSVRPPTVPPQVTFKTKSVPLNTSTTRLVGTPDSQPPQHTTLQQPSSTLTSFATLMAPSNWTQPTTTTATPLSTLTVIEGGYPIGRFTEIPSPVTPATDGVSPSSPSASFDVPPIVTEVPFATITPSTPSSRTYDDGMWHTTYPAWNETTATWF